MTSMILVVCLLILSTSVYGNSGPSYWEGKQSSEILTIKDNTQIAVEKEDLIFDFTDEDYQNYSLSARVTAKYTMSNKAESSEKVQMAFPFISSIGGFNPDDIDIKVDNELIDFQVFLGDMVHTQNKKNPEDNVEDMKFDFESIAKSISNSEYIPRNYNLDDIGNIYKYDVISNSEDGVSIAIEHYNDENKSVIINKGFNGYQMLDGSESFVSRNVVEEELEIFVLGQDVDLKFKAYSDVDLENETDKYSLDIKVEDISMRDYIEDAIEIFKNQVEYLDHIAGNQIFNAFAKQLDEDIEIHMINLNLETLLSIDRMDMFLVLIYDVDFPPNSTKEVSVSYNSSGTMDRTESVEPIYSFAYILNPAKNWASFNDLNIEIKPPESNPYIIDSSLDLIRNEEGIYTGNFENLPDEDLFFSLYYNERITRMDKAKGFLRRNSFMMYNLLTMLLGILIGSIIKGIYKMYKKRH